MRHLQLFIFGLLITLGATPLKTAHSNDHTSYAYIGVNILPMDQNRVLKNQILIVENGIISKFGAQADIDIPEGVTIINAEGKYLLPGLSDMHSHLRGGNDLLLYLATGVTTLRHLSGGEHVLGLINQIENKNLLGPELYSTSPILEGENNVWNFSIKITDPNEVDDLIKGFKDEGYQAVKIYHTISREVHEAVVKAGLKYDIPIVGHVSFDDKIEAALGGKQSSIEHLRGYDIDGLSMETLAKDGGRSAERFASWQTMTDARMTELVDMTLKAGTWNTPTFVVVELLYDKPKRADIANHPDLNKIPPGNRAGILSNGLDEIFSIASKEALRGSMPAMYKFINLLNQKGAGLMTGTDTMVPYIIPGFTPIEEMAHFIKAGLSPFEALKTSTSNPAKFLGKEKEFGTIKEGLKANFIVVEDNPLEDIKNLWDLNGVSIRGQWLSKEKLNSLIQKQMLSYEEQ